MTLRNRALSSISGLFSSKDRNNSYFSGGPISKIRSNEQTDVLMSYPLTCPTHTWMCTLVCIANHCPISFSPWLGSNRACIPTVWGRTRRASCGLRVMECRSRRTTRRRTARWSARNGWRGRRRTGRCRLVLRRERVSGVSSEHTANKGMICTLDEWPLTRGEGHELGWWWAVTKLSIKNDAFELLNALSYQEMTFSAYVIIHIIALLKD